MNEDQMYYEVGQLYLSLRNSEIERQKLVLRLKDVEAEVDGVRMPDNGRVSPDPVEVESD